MISIPVAVHNNVFKWQLDLFWFNHKQTYGEDAKNKAYAIIINQDNLNDVKYNHCEWDIDIPHQMCDPFFDFINVDRNVNCYNGDIKLLKPLNIQSGLLQIIDNFDDEQIIELIDCDMFHFKPHSTININDDELLVSTLYEPWHLLSLSTNKSVIEPYFKNDGKYYNGGFVPIIGKVKTFRKLLWDWIDIHNKISNIKFVDNNFIWWAGMFSLNAACERNKITMIDNDVCYIPQLIHLIDTHYIGHYSVDDIFNKRQYPNVDLNKFLDNDYYNRIRNWIESIK